MSTIEEMVRIIVIEGPDGSGKSTLVKSLKNMTGFLLTTKAVSSDMRATLDLREYIESTLKQRFGKRLYDRFALVSGPIYGPICGMAPPNDVFKDPSQTFLWLNEFYAWVRPLIIYCLPPFDEVKRNVAEDDFNAAVRQGKIWEKAYWAYFMKLSQDTVFHPDRTYWYDYTRDTPHGPYNWISQKVGSDRA